MTVVAAVDGDQIPDPVVETAADLAVQYGDELVVVHVMGQEAYESRDAGGVESANFEFPTASETGYSDRESNHAYSVDEAQRDAAGVARDVVRGTLESEPESVTYLGRVGDVVSAVTDVVADCDARYLVIGGRKRSPVGKAVFGSATQSFLLNASVPVVAVMTEAAE